MDTSAQDDGSSNSAITIPPTNSRSDGNGKFTRKTICNVLHVVSGAKISWLSLLSDATGGNGQSLGLVMVMFIVQMCLYMFVTWYVTSIRPGPYGRARPWYFIFQVSFITDHFLFLCLLFIWHQLLILIVSVIDLNFVVYKIPFRN